MSPYLGAAVAKLELEHHARGEVIKHLREEREDHRASSLRIRTLLAPLLGVDVNNEPADEMVGRFVALYNARDERVAEKRGHDKAMEWAATLAFDFDPFSEDWTDEQRGAGERVLGLFAERLRDEAGWGIPPIEADQNLVERGVAAGYREASTGGARCIRDDGVELRRTETGFVDDRPYESGGRFRHSMGGPVVHQFSSIGADTARCGFLSRGPYTPSAEPTTCPGCLDPDRYCLQHAHMGWPRTLKVDCPECAPMPQTVKESLRTWNPPLVPAPSLDGGLTKEEVAAVRVLLKREGK